MFFSSGRCVSRAMETILTVGLKVGFAGGCERPGDTAELHAAVTIHPIRFALNAGQDASSTSQPRARVAQPNSCRHYF